MKILFLCLYPENTAPSQRFRFEQYFPYFKEAGVSFDIDCYYSETTYRILYQRKAYFKKAILIASAYLRRLFRLSKFRKYDYIFIQRAAAPMGPALFEYILVKWFGKRIIYDFDDAIWMPQDGKGSKFYKWLKSYGKVGKICRLAHQVMVGNDFLADYARKFTNKVAVVPTVVDTQRKYTVRKQSLSNGNFVVGWTGSHSTIRYLLSLSDVLRRLDKEPKINFLIIADKMAPELELSKMNFVSWNEDNEIDDLLKMDIGLMPLVDNDWTRGKCGFKAIQYMALGIPALVSPVGVNEKIVDDNINGFICRSPKDWEEKILFIQNNPELRKKMGLAARVKIEQCYSVNYAFPLILSFLNED